MPRQDKHYNKTREDFDSMGLEDRAAFLIEATFSTAAEALDRAGRELADFVEDLDQTTEDPKKKGSSSESSGSTDPAESSKSPNSSEDTTNG
jgi:hypothetical protein